MVYQEVTTWAVEESGWLGILGLVHQRRTLEQSHESNMPSWVVDFTANKPSTASPLRLREDQPGLEKAAALMTSALKPVVDGAILEVSARQIGTILHVGNSYNEMLDDADFDRTAQLLLDCSAIVSSEGKTRIDWWMDILQDRESREPSDDERRTAFTRYLRFIVFRKLQRDTNAGIIKTGADTNDFFQRQPSFLRLAVEDETHTIPTHESWLALILFLTKQDAAFRERDLEGFQPRLPIQGRRLALVGDLNIAEPAAKLLAIVPEAVEVGDEICLVAGSAVPFLLRRAPSEPQQSVLAMKPCAFFVGEALVNGCGELMDMFGCDYMRLVRPGSKTALGRPSLQTMCNVKQGMNVA
ncbi:hypothetical protein LTR95_018226 [Oleoguttula sp. CCFEE 5521]